MLKPRTETGDSGTLTWPLEEPFTEGDVMLPIGWICCDCDGLWRLNVFGAVAQLVDSESGAGAFLEVARSRAAEDAESCRKRSANPKIEKKFYELTMFGAAPRRSTGNWFSAEFISKNLLIPELTAASSSPKRKRVVLVWSSERSSWMPVRDLVTGIEYRLRLYW